MLEYSSVIWQTGLISKIERVQNRFLRVLAFKINKTGVSLKQLASDYGIELLDKRRNSHDVPRLYE